VPTTTTDPDGRLAGSPAALAVLRQVVADPAAGRLVDVVGPGGHGKTVLLDALFTAVVDAVRRGADGAVPVLPVLEVVQRVHEGRVVATLPKHDLVLTQSPQAFRAAVLRAVHADRPRPVENSGLLVERGHRVDTVPGDPANLHVTTPAELALLDRLATEGLPV
jgi:2-C-methyl-D-erythritol 4-phosphate cytidylyltransferase